MYGTLRYKRFTLWTPANITTLAWYDASDASTITLVGSKVSAWTSKSGTSNTASQGTDSKRPTNGSSINGVNAFDFVSTNLQELTMATNIDFVNRSIFGVGVIDNVGSTLVGAADTGVNKQIRVTSTELRIPAVANNWISGTPTGEVASTASYVNSNPHVWCYEGGNPLYFYVDGARDANSYTRYGTSAFNIRRIGGWTTASDTPYDGRIGEVIFVSIPSTAVRQQIEGYLAWKWGLQDNLPVVHPYKMGPPRAA